MGSRRTIAIVGALISALAVTTVVRAADFPTKPIQIIVPFKPGGGSDMSARVFAKYASKYLPERVVVTNIAGARGRAAELEVKRSRPDGYMVLWQHQNLHMAFATGRSKYDYTVFQPVASTVRADTALIAAEGSSFKTLAELNAAARAKPGTIRWGAAINGFSHFAYLTYLNAAGLAVNDFHTIGMSGDKNRIVAMMQGNLDITIVALSAARPYLESGDVTLLGILSDKRSDAYPDLPTLKEKGVDATFNFDYMSFVPLQTPADRVRIIRDAWLKAAQDPECKAELNRSWMTPASWAGDSFERYLADQFASFNGLSEKFGLLKKSAK